MNDFRCRFAENTINDRQMISLLDHNYTYILFTIMDKKNATPSKENITQKRIKKYKI